MGFNGMALESNGKTMERGLFVATAFLSGDVQEVAQKVSATIRRHNERCTGGEGLLVPVQWRDMGDGVSLMLVGRDSEGTLTGRVEDQGDGMSEADFFVRPSNYSHLGRLFGASFIVGDLMASEEGDRNLIDAIERFGDGAVLKRVGYPSANDLMLMGMDSKGVGAGSSCEHGQEYDEDYDLYGYGPYDDPDLLSVSSQDYDDDDFDECGTQGVTDAGSAASRPHGFGLRSLVGRGAIVSLLAEGVACGIEQKRCGYELPNLSVALLGNAGTGKSAIASGYARMLVDSGLLPEGAPFVKADLEGDLGADIERARGGILFLDNADCLSRSQAALLSEADSEGDISSGRGAPIVLMTVHPSGFKAVSKCSPNLFGHFGVVKQLDDFDAQELFSLFKIELSKRGVSLDDEAKSCLRGYCETLERNKKKNFGNARGVQNISDHLCRECYRRPGSSRTLDSSMVRTVFEDRFALSGGRGGASHLSGGNLSGDEQLDRLIGLNDAKEQIREFLNFAKIQRERGGRMPSLHMRFDGNPGTGKTTIARIIRRMMADRGLLWGDGQFVEANRSMLVGEYIGSTAPKTKEIVKMARHGLLFIDEAYSLASPNNERDFGREAISALIDEMENCNNNFEKDGFVCIMAGYPELMDDMVSVNPGLRDRFGLHIQIEDYSAEELLQIFDKYVKDDSYEVTDDARAVMAGKLEDAVASRVEDFSNARLVRKIFERMKIKQAALHGSDVRIGMDTVSRVFEEKDISLLVHKGDERADEDDVRVRADEDDVRVIGFC